ncbi:MAG: radical SAM family heme chaperone HemW [Armatimonadetes bacterium]|nr:radical SAM family heme chaperone HemW [Armatimonadota bacterium]
MTPVAVYVHTPFCPSKCGYCDFNSYAMSGDVVDRTVAAMLEEIERSPWKGRPAKTVFFGGGTPTFLSESQICGLLEAVLEAHPPVEACEITSEANPGTVDMPKFAAMRAAGFNRISLGAQSFDSGDLMRLGRVHDADHIARAVGSARAAGFENLNLDLMFGLPGQSMRGWRRNLATALALRPDHLSLYGLTIEPNTRYYRLHLRGMLDLPDDDLVVEMYDEACSQCAAAGLEQYEISNFGRECQHNLCYWRGEEYLAYGPGAVGCFVDGEVRQRYTNMKHPERYVEAVESGGSLWCDSEVVDTPTHEFEKLMLGLRLNAGVSADVAHDAAGRAKMVASGWLEEVPGLLRLTPEGRHWCSTVTSELAPG